MVRSLILLLALFAIPAHALTVGSACGANQLSIAGLCLSTTGLKILHGGNYASANSSLRDVSLGLTTSATYQVPSGKNFVLYAVRYESTEATGLGDGCAFMYADNAVGDDSATALTNPVGMLSGVAGAATRGDVIFSSEHAGTIRDLAIGGHVPALKYPTLVFFNTHCKATLYGYEI